MKRFSGLACNIAYRCILFAAGCLVFLSVHSQQYNFHVYGTRDGLVNSIVKTIFLDSRGYIWFGTQGGVSRFDGKTFRNFTEKDGLPGNDITTINEDQQGNIWIGTYGFGVAVYNGSSFTQYSDSTGLPNNIIYSIFPGDSNYVWITTFGGGIARYNSKTKKFDVFNTSTGLQTDKFLKGERGASGDIWFGTRGKGVYRYDGRNFTNYNSSDGLTATSYYSVYNDRKGRTWLGSTSKGIDIVERDYSIHHLSIPEIDGDLISGIIEDRHGNYWIAGKQGLYKYNEQHPMLFTDKQGLPSNSILSLAEDRDGNIWVGTTAGVCLFRNEAVVSYTDKEGLSRKNVTSFFTDSHGNRFTGMAGGGVGLVLDNAVQPLDIPELNGQTVIAFCEDADGRIWIGCDNNDNGVVVIEKSGGNWRKYKTYVMLAGATVKTVTRIIRDHNDNIWLACYGAGVIRIGSDNSAVSYDDSTGLPTNNVLTVFEDMYGMIWVGTLHGGVVKIDPSGKMTTLTEKDGLADNSVWAITGDQSGNIFFGTNDNGVSCYDGKKFVTISAKQGLCSDLVYALICDDKNRLWVGTDKGVNRISFGKNFAVVTMKYFGENDGLRGTEIGQNALYLDKSGNIWIGTNEGLIRYQSQYDYINDNPPRLELTGLRLYYQAADWSKMAFTVDPRTGLPVNPEFSYKDNHLTFDYQALTTDNVRYQFMLEGVDADWSPLTTNTSAVYTNIPPGDHYVFRVKAVNRDGFWSKEVLTYSFSVSPPFWKTWWFYSLIAVLAAASIFGFIRWRTQRLEVEKKVLEARVQERTQELQVANDHLSVAYTDIKDSINYAKRIQSAILPLEQEIRKSLPDHFIFFRPRDVVSGDFYWYYSKGDLVYFAAIDCTGHGVPGAFMSIIGNSLLHEIMNEIDSPSPGAILNTLRDKLMMALRQTGAEAESKDGMDMMLCCYDRKNSKLTFSGANNPLYLVSDGVLTEFKSDKQPIGVYGDVMKPFTEKEITIRPDDRIYIFSDGYPDQFGGVKGKKFMYTRFKQLLTDIHHLDMPDQLQKLEHEFYAWKGENEQVDDVLVMGFRF
jgi:ligand-binding sensor domain-containing protein/serine phosphatase RsbU (regulator of sigma subunit)